MDNCESVFYDDCKENIHYFTIIINNNKYQCHFDFCNDIKLQSQFNNGSHMIIGLLNIHISIDEQNEHPYGKYNDAFERAISWILIKILTKNKQLPKNLSNYNEIVFFNEEHMQSHNILNFDLHNDITESLISPPCQ